MTTKSNRTLNRKLASALISEDWKSIRELIEQGAPVDLKDEEDMTALMRALISRRKDALKNVVFLVETGASLNVCLSYDRATISRLGGAHLRDEGPDADHESLSLTVDITPLIAAVRRGSAKMVKYLLSKGADVNARGSDGYTALMEVLRYQSDEKLAIVKQLLAKGAYVNARADDGDTAMLIAVGFGSEETLSVVKELIAEGANVNARGCDGYTALWSTVFGGECFAAVDIAKELVANGADVNITEPVSNKGLLILALEKLQTDMVEFLLDSGADVTAKAADGTTPLLAASDHWSIAKRLIERGADVNAANDVGDTALMLFADRRGPLHFVSFLASKGADINVANSAGVTALMKASAAGAFGTVQILVKEGASVGAVSRDGRTALSEGATSNNVELVKYLVAAGADVHSRTMSGDSVLRLAATHSTLEMVDYFIGKGVMDEEAVASARTEDIAVRLLENGGRITTVASDGGTVLTSAIKNDWSLDFIARALNEGVDPNIRPSSGPTNLEYALYLSWRDDRQALVNLLAAHGATESLSYPYFVRVRAYDPGDLQADKNYLEKSGLLDDFDALDDERKRGICEASEPFILEQIRDVLQEHAETLCMRGTLTEARIFSGRVIGFVFTAGISASASQGIFEMIAKNTRLVSVTEFLTNSYRAFRDYFSPFGFGGAESLYVCRVIRDALEDSGLLPRLELDFSVVPIWRIIGDCVLRAHNHADEVDGIDVFIEEYRETEEGEDGEVFWTGDTKRFSVVIAANDASVDAEIFVHPFVIEGEILLGNDVAEINWRSLRDACADEVESLAMRESGLTVSEFETRVQAFYADSMRIDPDTLLRGAVSGCDIDMIRQALEAGTDIESSDDLLDFDDDAD